MTSKISFFKLLKEDFKRRSWLVALIWLNCFILQPIVLMLNIDGMLNSVRNGYSEMAYVIENYRIWVGAGNNCVSMLVIAAAIVTGISGYSFLHSRVKLDFYHSLPIPRKKFFFVQYVSGILMFFIPHAMCTLLCLLVGAANGLLTGEIAVLAVKMIVYHMMEFLAVYGTAILAAILTGKVLTALLGTAVFAAYIPGVILVLLGMKDMFFDTFVQGGKLEEYSMLLSPVLSGWYAESMIASNHQTGKWVVIGIGVMLIWTLLMTGLSVWLYRIRKTEAAENSMAFPKTEGVIQVLLVVPLSLAVGLYLQQMVYTDHKYWFFVGIVCAAVILSAVIEFIYHLNMREIFKHKLQILLAGVLSLAIALLFRYDITGYDTYLPAKENVAQMSLYADFVNGSFYYPVSNGSYDCYSVEAALNATLTDDFDVIYTMAEKGARGSAVDEEQAYTVYVEYRLKSGRREMRRYTMNSADVDAAYEKLFQTPDFIAKMYPVLGVETDAIRSVSVCGIFGNEDMDCGKEKRQEFLEIYREELRKICYEDIKNHVVSTLVLTRTFEVNYSIYGLSEVSYSEDGYPICDSFTKTIAFLKDEMGIDVKRQLTAEDVGNIQISDYRTGGEGKITTVKEPEQIQEILDCVRYSPLYSMVSGAEDMDIYILLNNGNSASGRFYFKKGSVPEFLKQDLEIK